MSYKTLDGLGLREVLTPDRFAQRGVVFAFITHFVVATPVRLHVWRPVGTSSSADSYQLICEWRIDVTGDQLSRLTVVRTQPTMHLQ